MADPQTALHYAVNSNFVNGAYAPGGDGFNLADVTPSSVGSLPSGVKGLVWVGDSISGATASFQSTINSLVGNPNVYGFYLADEPSPGNAANLKAESDYIHAHDPGVKTFIVLLNNSSDSNPQFSYNPANTDIDLFGVDPYPVQTSGTNYSSINASVAAAEAEGIPQSQIVPVYQAFGGLAPWVTPTLAQEQTILSTWGSLIPAPAFDYAYSWGAQSGDTALVNDPALAQVFAAHNAGSSGRPPSSLVGKVQLSSATEATALASGTPIATFTDSNTADTAAGFTASITWGDGATSAGAITGASGSFSVTGGHTYADEGSFPLSVAITRAADKATIAPTGTVVAVEADTLTANATTITATAGQALNNVSVATFTDSDTANVAADFTASIKWGDGTTSAGTVNGSNGKFTVAGSHTYAAAGTDAVAVTLTDATPGTATATANSTAQVGSGGGGGSGGGVPAYSHVVVVMEENHAFNEIIGSSSAPYINGTLAAGGALLTNYSAVAHPSEPNYFAIYAGSTFGVTDDNTHFEPDPTLATQLHAAGKAFTGYVEASGSDMNHNPWQYFPEGTSVESDFNAFPTNNFAILPPVSFVIPGVNDDMHNGTIAQGDTWLQININAYAQWAKANNSLLAVVWDEDDGTQNNQVPAILYGANVTPGTYGTAYNHYNLLATISAAAGITGPNNAATAAPISGMFGTSPPPSSNLIGRAVLSSATEHLALPATTAIATFTDSNTADTAAGFTASITWGDGATSAGAITGASGSFSVTGGHTYADEGSFPLSVAITRAADKATIAPTGTVVAVEADTLTANATTITATAGQALNNVSVATFTDSDTANVAADFTASIKWGDGTTSAGTVNGSNGKFTVAGSHTYAAAGTDAVAVTLTDATPGTATATANSTAQIGSATGTLAGKVQLSSATEATALASGTPIATFTDSNTADTAAGFTASITWGDGATSAGAITGASGSFSVTGGHTYADEGSFPLSVAITRAADKATIAPTGTVVAVEADTLTANATTITATAGQALNNVSVATFTDSDTANVAADFTASIKWGDGTTSAGTVNGSNGKFTVAGSHTYAAAGTDAVAVTLTDATPGTATATANSTAQVGSGGGGGGLTISGPRTGPVAFTAAESPLTITTSGSVTSTGTNVDAIDGPSTGNSAIINSGTVSATGTSAAGVYLQAGGTVTNSSGASISGDYGVYMSSAAGVVSNSGTISGRSEAVHFANSGSNRVVVNPSAVFNGSINGGSATSILELAGGTGSIGGLSGGSGTVTENGNWSFTNFQTLSVDAGGTWTLNGGNVATIANTGTIGINGSLDVSSAVDPGSSGLFNLTSGATFDVAAAIGSASRMAFLGPSRLVIDNPLSFGSNVGSASYAGPTLQGFGSVDTIDVKQLSATGAVSQYDASKGLLQISNSSQQRASLDFQTSSLGSGTFHIASDGGGGILLTVN